ncbi:CCA tRNA nucleotidyltransferase [Prevotella sp. AGR2160]|uniref:CCA tRNA nucleotidyltransferase n=1 Tax=Prevotella sp. AGR2160 TaxID=1280674 RepID=UPI00042A5CF5|nr:HD domain-containing protein [Prevotella sp. AGR2160]
MKLYTDAQLAQLLDKEIFHMIGDVADGLGVECYVVGGYVRDLFLDRPSNDIDVVVVGSGITVAEGLRKRLGRKAHVSVFRNFGTAQVKYKGLEVEFVGARKESYSHDSRKPHVEDGTLEDDQNRRDFTINAMAICLNKGRFGELVDPFYGIEDLEDGIIATPLEPGITFSDDPLRMMRCVRFATQLNFQIEDETWKALCDMKDRIKIVSGERVKDELNKIVLAPHPSIGFDYLQRSGLLALILPELSVLDIVEKRNGRAHKNNFYHTLEVLEHVVTAEKNAGKEPNLWLRWAALLHDVGKTKTKRWEEPQGWTFHNHNYVGAKMVPVIFRRLDLPLDSKMKYVQKLVDLHMRPIVIADEQVTDSAVRRLLNDAGDDIDDLMTLCEADITSKNAQRKQRFLDNFKLVREKLADLKERDYKRLLQPCIDGNEIMELFHLKPSREVGELKQCLKDAVLDGTVENEREPLMQLLKKKAEEMGIA